MTAKLANRSRQRGMTMLGWIVVILVVGSISTVGIRLLPHYLDYQTILSIMDALPKSDIHGMAKSEIRDNLKKRFKINNIRDLQPKNVVRINRLKGATELFVDYEVREHFIANIYLILHFKKEFAYS